MPRYIDIDRFITEHSFEADVNAKYRALIRELEEFPTVDINPVIYATWKEANSRSKSFMFVCSNCLKVAYSNISGSAKHHIKRCDLEYCPHCGARMDGADNG